MQKDTVYTKNAPEPIGPYSQGIYVSWDMHKMLYTSGQVAIDPKTGNFINGGIKEKNQASIGKYKSIAYRGKK